jgi:hypothetical protein
LGLEGKRRIVTGSSPARRCPSMVRDFYANMFGAFPDLSGDPDTQTAQAPNTLVRCGMFGAGMVGPYLGIPPTGGAQ